MALLHIDTSTSVCSVALTEGDELLSACISEPLVQHAAVLPSYISHILDDARKRKAEIECVSVSEGPGSYTGLRIGVSTAKGLAYGMGVKLVSVPTLELLAYEALMNTDIEDDAWLCPMIDARRMEVYMAIYDKALNIAESVRAQVVSEDSFDDVLEGRKVYFFGDGASKCRSVICHPNAIFLDIRYPDARYMGRLAQKRLTEGKTEDVAYFTPFYLKEFVAAASHVKGLQ